MTEAQIRQIKIKAAWCNRMHNRFPQVGKAFDGRPIRNEPWFGHSVQELSGYCCTPVAYVIRNKSC